MKISRSDSGEFRGKKVLLVGLGRLGGGLAMAKFFIAQGARLTITDLKTAAELKDSVKKLKHHFTMSGIVKLPKMVFGEHREEDFLNNEIIVCNPATPISSPWVQLAFRKKKRVLNDLVLFLELLRARGGEYLAVTGTRGKTTTTHWLHHFVGGVVGGNQPGGGFLDIITKKGKRFVVEVPSYQLEFMRGGLIAPRVAIITNVYVDHINRHGTFKKYRETKANLFLNQRAGDFLILNADDPNTKLFLARKPKSAVFYTSLCPLPKQKNGLFFMGEKIYFQYAGQKELITAVLGMSEHEKRNLLAAMLGAHMYGVTWKSIVFKIKTLPSVPLRQEVMLKKNGLTIINDSAATSPEAVIAALEKFVSKIQPLDSRHREVVILIVGGTDKQLEFKNLAQKIKKTIPEGLLYLLEGSATTKLIAELRKLKYFKKEPQIFFNLELIIRSVHSLVIRHYPPRTKPRFVQGTLTTLLFSPGAASFEKFKNEFDRGKKFNALVKKYFKE